jgi:type I restriction enzyme R subunit
MAKSNSVEQLKGSTKFSDASDYAMFQAFQNTDEIKKALADPEMLANLLAITAEKMHAEYHAADETPIEANPDEAEGDA